MASLMKGGGGRLPDELIEAHQGWYAGRCEGVREHQRGVRIETLDNSGRRVEVNVGELEEGRAAAGEVKEERAADDWIAVAVRDGVFAGCGGPRNLREILLRFVAVVGRGGVDDHPR